MVEILCPFLLSLAAAIPAIAVTKRWAERREILDHPNERSSHSTPTPRGGGLAIVVTTLLAAAIVELRNGDWPLRWFAAVTMTAILVALVGWLDDLYTLSSLLRIGVHLLAASLLMMTVGFWTELPMIGRVPAIVGVGLTLLWIVGLTNAYNFMDGIDGIAGGQAVVAGLGLAWLVWSSGDKTTAGFGMAIAGSATGFLFYNWQPARIFMGDVGSSFLGFLFASLTLVSSHHGSRFIVAGFLVVWPFVFDSAFTFLRRLRRGERVFEAHRSHLYQRLVRTGVSHAVVAKLYMALAAAGVVAAIPVKLGVFRANAWAAGSVGLLASALWIVVVVRERQLREGISHAHGPER